MKTIEFQKSKYPEIVVRKALYWLSEYASWKLDESNESWMVTLPENDDTEFHFHRLLNDFLLRDKIDVNTKRLRQTIIEQALIKVYQHNE